MKTHTSFMFLIIGTLALAIGYFYVEKTNPEFFQNLMNKFTQKEEVPQEPKIEDEKVEEVTPKKTEPEKPSDDELLPPKKKDNRRPRNRPHPSLLIEGESVE